MSRKMRNGGASPSEEGGSLGWQRTARAWKQSDTSLQAREHVSRNRTCDRNASNQMGFPLY